MSCLAFTDDGSHLVSCGKDGNVLVWNLLEVLSAERLPGQAVESVSKPEPRQTWSDHRLEVTDLHISSGGALKSRIFTASLDHTSKIYCLASGRLLLDISFAVPLTSVTVDNAETSVFVGSESGKIFTFSLLSPPRDLQVTLDPDDASHSLVGHSKAVTQLSVSLDGLSLASGSDDHDLRIWNVKSRRCLRTIEHKGKLTFARYMAPAKGMLRPEQFKPALVISNLEKTVSPSERENLKLELIVRHRQEEAFDPQDSAENLLVTGDKRPHQSGAESNGHGDSSEDSHEVKKLKAINQQLYQYAVKNVMKSNNQ